MIYSIHIGQTRLVIVAVLANYAYRCSRSAHHPLHILWRVPLLFLCTRVPASRRHNDIMQCTPGHAERCNQYRSDVRILVICFLTCVRRSAQFWPFVRLTDQCRSTRVCAPPPSPRTPSGSPRAPPPTDGPQPAATVKRADLKSGGGLAATESDRHRTPSPPRPQSHRCRLLLRTCRRADII